jgi:hypothetical protein
MKYALIFVRLFSSSTVAPLRSASYMMNWRLLEGCTEASEARPSSCRYSRYKAEAVAPVLRLRIASGKPPYILADAHDLADGAHLSAQLVWTPLNFSNAQRGELDAHIVAVGNVLIQCARTWPQGISSSVRPQASIAETRAMGKAGRLGSQR